jgi:hypothetical protein
MGKGVECRSVGHEGDYPFEEGREEHHGCSVDDLGAGTTIRQGYHHRS